MKWIKNIVVVFVFFLLLGDLSGQTTTEPTLEDEELEVVKSFNATLSDADKKHTLPTLPPMDPDSERKTDYTIPPRLLTLEYDAPDIRPLAMRQEPTPKVYDLYAKLGIGYPISPYAQVIYNNHKIENLDLYAKLFHHSANNNGKVENQRFSESSAKVKGTFFLEKGLAIGAHAGFDLDNVYFYGYNDSDTSFAKTDVLQRFTTLDAGLDVSNSKPNELGIDYKAELGFYSLNDKFDVGETGISASASARKWIAEKHHIDLEINESFYNFKDTTSAINNVLSFSPSFSFGAGIFRAKAGVYLGISDEFVVMPDVEARLSILEGMVNIFGGWTGKIQENTFRTITNTNPFVNTPLGLKNSTIEQRYGGIRGKISTLSYEAKFTQSPIQNRPFFVNDSLDFKRFDVVYDEKVNLMNVHGMVTLEALQSLKVWFSGDYNIYNTLNEAAAWHLPTLAFNAGATYKLLKKLDLKGELFVASGVPYKNELGEKDNLNSMLDLNFGAEYTINEHFGAFANVNNLLSSKYQRWYRYPQYGMNFMVGVVMKL